MFKNALSVQAVSKALTDQSPQNWFSEITWSFAKDASFEGVTLTIQRSRSKHHCRINGWGSGAVRLIYEPSEPNLLIERRVHRVLCLSVVEFGMMVHQRLPHLTTASQALTLP